MAPYCKVNEGAGQRAAPAGRRAPKYERSKAQPVALEVVETIQSALPEWMALAVPLGLGAGLRQGKRAA